ncbi:MAG: hypothetical protein IBJ10_05965 [Phycisphaerales bacterium]|nr:hypothetical protein [Phycisphaerales bacterium]
MKTMDMYRLCVGASALLAVSGAALAINFDPTGQAGQYDTTKAATRVRGSAGVFGAVRVWAPFILDESDASFNASVVETDAAGLPFGAVTTFFSATSATAVRTVTAFGTSDALNAGRSNNVFINEGPVNKSNSFGTMLPDGTVVWRANFSTLAPAQNNIEWLPIAWPANTAAPPANGNRVFGAFPGIDGLAGNVFLGTPGAEKRGQTLFVANTTFDPNATDAPNGASVWSNAQLGGVNPIAPVDTWGALSVPVPTVPAGETAADARQTQPMIKNATLPCVTDPFGRLYTAFGVGFSGGTPFTGGASRFLYFIVDEVNGSNFSDGYAFIDADGDNNLNTANPDKRFIDHQATGGGTEPFAGGMFDMNKCGEVVVVREDRSVTPRVFEVLLYRPNYNLTSCGIAGYQAPVVIARSGQDTIETNVQTTFIDNNQAPPAPFTDTLSPFSGVSIDDHGNIAFVAVTEQFFEIRDINGDMIPDGPVLLNTTNDLFFWERSSRTLHSVVRGGQNGDVLLDVAGSDHLMLGFFPVNVATDAFNRDGLSETGRTLALSFRSGGNEGAVDTDNDGFDDNGGVLRPGGAEQAVRGVVTVAMGAFNSPNPPCADVNFDGATNFGDLNIVLSQFNSAGQCLSGDLNGDGAVNFADLNLILGQFNTNCN